jgi:hypothetical protein
MIIEGRASPTTENHVNTKIARKRGTQGLGVLAVENDFGHEALKDAGWTVRNAIVWNKTNAMRESVTDQFGPIPFSVDDWHATTSTTRNVPCGRS